MIFVENKIYHPNILANFAKAIGTGLDRGPACRFASLVLGWHLGSYLKYLSEKGVADRLVRQYQKTDKELPVGKFILSKPLSQCRDKRSSLEGSVFADDRTQYRFLNPEDARFHIDGDMGFGIGYQSAQAREPLWLCVSSFSRSTTLAAYYRNAMLHFKRDDHKEDPNYEFIKEIAWNAEGRRIASDPIILQLQGVTGGTRGTYHDEVFYKEAVSMISGIKWEDALIRLCAMWAEQAGFSRIHILPGEDNAWNRLYDTERLSRFKKRYNWTAEQMGFRRDQNGFYAMQLAA